MDLKFVLIIEANNQLRFQWEDILRDHGYPVLSASSLKQAAMILRNFPVKPSVVIHNESEELPAELAVLLKLSSVGLSEHNLISSLRAIK